MKSAIRTNSFLFTLAMLVMGACHRPAFLTRDIQSRHEPCLQAFAIIGDYGSSSPSERRVSELVKSWSPAYIMTTGDNNYPLGAATTIDKNIGQYYHEYIGSYSGKYGAGSPENRFFPALGNHDLYTGRGKAYFNYFTLPGNERYYSIEKGQVAFFVLNSNESEPDGTSAASAQAVWLRQALETSPATWKLVIMHHAPYSSGPHGSAPELRWPFDRWGVDVVISGHEHLYERITVGGFPYLINGLGGKVQYAFGVTPVEGSEVRYNAEHGAMRGCVTESALKLSFINTNGTVIDSLVLKR